MIDALNETIAICILLVIIFTILSFWVSNNWQKSLINSLKLICSLIAIICSLMVLAQ